MFRRSFRTLLIAAGGGLVVLAGCGSTHLDSRWRAEALQPDGSVSSWQGVEYESDAGLVIGTVNDGEYLWVRLVPADERAQRQLMHGVTVWIGDEKKKEDRRLGLRIAGIQGPMGSGPADRDRDRDRKRDRDGTGDRDPDRTRERSRDHRPGPAELAKLAAESLKSIEVLSGSGAVVETRKLPAEQGLDVHVETTDVVSYVFRIPLRSTDDDAVAVGGKPGQTIGLGVESAPLPEPRGGEGMRGGPSGGGPGPGGGPPPGGGRGGRGGGGLGGRGGGPSGERPARPEPVDFWAKVKLSPAP